MNNLCGSARNKATKHEFSQSNIARRKKWKRPVQTRGGKSNGVHMKDSYDYRKELNVPIDSSISNIEQEADDNVNDKYNEDKGDGQNGIAEEQYTKYTKYKQYNDNDNDNDNDNNDKTNNLKKQRILIDRRSLDFVGNKFNLNYHGHIENHASPRQATPKSSNPYELILDQKRLHKIIKSVHYPV